jgi:DNA-binding NarL/FixJ family response regulator
VNQLRILVADDHDILRKGLRFLLTEHPGWSVCGEARNGREAVELTSALKPDIVILDLELPELNGIEATQQIKRQLPKTEVLIFTMHDRENLIAESLRAGARGYVLKSDSEEKLIEGIHALAKHLPFFSTTASETLLEHLLKAAGSEEASVLTNRERDIVQLLSKGKSNKQVASHLQISVKTVETHRSAIMRKLGLKSVAELVRYAIRNNIINP